MSKKPTIQLVKRAIFYRVHIVGANGETMLVSETYFNKGNAERAALSLAKIMKLPFEAEGR